MVRGLVLYAVLIEVAIEHTSAPLCLPLGHGAGSADAVPPNEPGTTSPNDMTEDDGRHPLLEPLHGSEELLSPLGSWGAEHPVPVLPVTDPDG